MVATNQICLRQGMERWYDQLGQPGIYRNDRFWLAGDHVVDPRVIDTPKIRSFVQSNERARKEFKMTDSQRMNVSCLSTRYPLRLQISIQFCPVRDIL